MRHYLLGFALSLLITCLAFFFRDQGGMVLSGLALLQAGVQIRLFFPFQDKWDLRVFLFMLLVLVIVVVGSLWVMNDLNMRMM